MTGSPVIDEIQDVLQEIPYHSLSSRVSSRTSKNYSYSDSFETYRQESQDFDYQTTSQKEDDNSFYGDYADDFETSSGLNSERNSKQLNDSRTDTKSESLGFGSAILDKRTVFDVSDLPGNDDKASITPVDIWPRFKEEITPAKKKTEQKISKREQKVKEIFIQKCLQRIQDHNKQCEQNGVKYNQKPISKRVPMQRSEIKREKLMESKFEAPGSLLAKIRMKNLLDTMDEASAVRIHDPMKCRKCISHHKKLDASFAREMFIKHKVNDLTRKEIEIKMEEHLIKMASLCL